MDATGRRPTTKGEGSLLGPSVRMEGDITSEESLAISGQFEGQIDIPKHEVEVTQGAVVKADIRANKVLICGRVEGNVQGIARVELTGTAEMTGNLETREIRVEGGAVFRGQVNILTDRN